MTQLLARAHQDPATAVSWPTTGGTSGAKAIAAVDTTNFRLSFTPLSNFVLVRVFMPPSSGVHTRPSFAVMDGSTVVRRSMPGSSQNGCMFVAPVTPGNSYTWDLGIGADSLGIGAYKWGGPNNTTAGDASGAAIYEIYDASNCLGAVYRNPVPSAGSTVFSAGLEYPMTELILSSDSSGANDITFTAPDSGIVRTRIYCDGSTPSSGLSSLVLFGTYDVGNAVLVGRTQPSGGAATDKFCESIMLIQGLTPGASYTYRPMVGVEDGSAGGAWSLIFGGDHVTGGGFGATYPPLQFEVWSA